MKTYIVLLRGINVSGKNKLPMAELRELLNDLEFQNVQTYIQSGNIILESKKAKSEICKIINEGIFAKFGYDVPVIARTVSDWRKVIANYPFPVDNIKIVAFVFLNRKVYETKIEVNGLNEDELKINSTFIRGIGFGGTSKCLASDAFISLSQVQRTGGDRQYRSWFELGYESHYTFGFVSKYNPEDNPEFYTPDTNELAKTNQDLYCINPGAGTFGFSTIDPDIPVDGLFLGGITYTGENFAEATKVADSVLNLELVLSN